MRHCDKILHTHHNDDNNDIYKMMIIMPDLT